MKYIYILILFTGFLFSNTVSDPYKNIEHIKLNNGLEVYLLSNKKSVNTQIELKVAVGMDVENETNYGLSHLVEHIVFRDQRVPYHDYMDYIKEEGASYINAYTSRYETVYKAIIDSNKSYWITKSFAEMLFDKNVTQQDLDSEKGAVQTEIGSLKWVNKWMWKFKSFFSKIAAPTKNMYENEFALKKPKELPDYYFAQQNNAHFTLTTVMDHYHTYYYPANMIVKIVGNFDMQKMKEIIQNYYANVTRTGTKKTIKPLENPKLNHKPHQEFMEGSSENIGYIGVKYILDDFKKYIVLEAYMDSIALRIQQKLRNELGKTYSIYAYSFGTRAARIIAVHFDGLHEEFEKNMLMVKQMISEDIKHITDVTIDKALKAYSKTYTSVEHDNASLMDLITQMQYLIEKLKIDKTPVEIFQTITHEDFRKVLKETFRDENAYVAVHRDYYFFPYDTVVISLLGMIILFLLYFNLYYLDIRNNAVHCVSREVLLSRRVSNRFLGFLYFMFIFLFASLMWAWIQYLFFTYVMGDINFKYTIDVPYSYLLTAGDMIMSIVIFLLLCRYIFRYWAKLEVTADALCLVGHRMKSIPKEDITDIQVVRWSIVKSFKSIGISILFWKPLVQLSLKDGSIYYIRSSNAIFLEKHLQQWREANDVVGITYE